MPTAPNVRIIPAQPQTAENRSKYRQLRVAAYCRVSTELEEQQNSYQVQITYYTDLANTIFSLFINLSRCIKDDYHNKFQSSKKMIDSKLRRMISQKKQSLGIKNESLQGQEQSY